VFDCCRIISIWQINKLLTDDTKINWAIENWSWVSYWLSDHFEFLTRLQVRSCSDISYFISSITVFQLFLQLYIYIYCLGPTLVPSAASPALPVTMFGIWSVIGESLGRESVSLNNLLCLMPWCVSLRFDALPQWVFQHVGLTSSVDYLDSKKVIIDGI